MTGTIWLCLAEGDEHGPRIRAWTTDPKRAGQLRADGLDMVEYRCLTASAPGEQQPVAWRYRAADRAVKRAWVYIDRSPRCDGWQVEPLYTSPPPAAGWDEWTVDDSLLLRKAMSNCGMAGPESIETLGIDFVQHARRVIRIVAERGCPPSRPDAGCDVRVEQLEWRDHRPDAFPEPAWSAQTPFGFYNIEEVSASDSPAYVVRLHAHHFVADKDDLEDAKAAAHADYERRILSALSNPPAAVESNGRVEAKNALYWAVGRWNAEVLNRPLRNVHRRSLDTTWRQVIRHFGGDDVELCGPRHDELVAEQGGDHQ